MKEYFLNFFTLTDDQADDNAIYESINKGLQIKGPPLVILFCAIIIASVGLQVNSTAVVIGAMLVSPIMGAILSIGYSLATYDFKLLRKGLFYLFLQMLIAILGSMLYFYLSPIKTPSEELIARTSPTFFDVLIALFGGIAGIIGITRIEKTNVIPGVAIATALMPPLCTVGYGLAIGDSEFYSSALYLFLINAFYITLATFFMVKFISTNKTFNPPKVFATRIRRVLTALSLVITIPSIWLMYNISQDDSTLIEKTIEDYIVSEGSTETRTIVSVDVSIKFKKIIIFYVGDDVSESKVDSWKDEAKNAGFKEYKIELYRLDANQK